MAVSELSPAVRARPRIRVPRLIRLIARDGWACAGAIIVLLFIVLAIAAPLLAPYPDQGRGEPDIASKLLPPSATHWMGTDELGRDILSRIIFAAQPSLGMAALVVLMAVAIGVPIGSAAGYAARWGDEVLMRTTDVFLAFTPLLLAVLVAAALGPGYWTAILALGITWWPWYARLARGQAASLRSRDFVDAARLIGVPAPVILGRHIVPNLIGPVIVQATLDLSAVILVASGLSFLGLGTQPPDADWGVMVNDARQYFLSAPWYVLFSGLAIIVVSIGFVLLGDGLRRILNLRPEEGAR